MLRAIDKLVLRPGSSLRPPAWRWALARELIERLPENNRRTGDVDSDDPDVIIAAIIQQGAENPDATEKDREELLERVEDYQLDAYVFRDRATLATITDPVLPPGSSAELYPLVGPLTADAVSRAQLEALILARKKTGTIAKVTGLSTAAVEQYERWWFDVRDRLQHPGWVAASAIGSLLQGPPALLLPAIIRAFGYYTRSARIVSKVVGTFDAVNSRAMAQDPAKFFANDAVDAGGLKAALAVRLMPLSGKTYGRVMELHCQAMEVAAKLGHGAGSEAEARLREATQRLFSHLDHKHREPPVEIAPGMLAPRLVVPAGETG